jgi:hypothetical protein
VTVGAALIVTWGRRVCCCDTTFSECEILDGAEEEVAADNLTFASSGRPHRILPVVARFNAMQEHIERRSPRGASKIASRDPRGMRR